MKCPRCQKHTLTPRQIKSGYCEHCQDFRWEPTPNPHSFRVMYSEIKTGVVLPPWDNPLFVRRQGHQLVFEAHTPGRGMGIQSQELLDTDPWIGVLHLFQDTKPFSRHIPTGELPALLAALFPEYRDDITDYFLQLAAARLEDDPEAQGG